MVVERNGRNFVEIVREMITEGESFKEAASNLRLLGLSREDAEKLIAIVETKSEPVVKSAIERMVKIKLESAAEAWHLKKKRRARSKRRRKIARIRETQFSIAALLQGKAPEKIPLFRKRIDNYIEALNETERAKKDVLGFLLQLKKEKLLRRSRSSLRQAIEFFQETS